MIIIMMMVVLSSPMGSVLLKKAMSPGWRGGVASGASFLESVL